MTRGPICSPAEDPVPRKHDHDHSHDHSHPQGPKAWLREIFVPHTHDASEAIDDALEASSQGIRAVKVSLVLLALTAGAQLAVVSISGSVALLADTIHNFSDALTAVPLSIAFILGRRDATDRYTYGYGRAEDLAGLFVVAMIALSALLAGVESVRRLADPQPLANLGWVLAAGVIGFAGNEAVAIYRVRVGRRIGSAALVADGVHARTDGFTSLAVVLGVVGVWAGYPLADSVIGLLITAAILLLLWGTARDVGRRLLDGVDPALTGSARRALKQVDGIGEVCRVRLRWSGHRLTVQARVGIDPQMTIVDAEKLITAATQALHEALPATNDVDVITSPATG